jgi:hypothetical protein
MASRHVSLPRGNGAATVRRARITPTRQRGGTRKPGERQLRTEAGNPYARWDPRGGKGVGGGSRAIAIRARLSACSCGFVMGSPELHSMPRLSRSRPGIPHRLRPPAVAYPGGPRVAPHPVSGLFMRCVGRTSDTESVARVDARLPSPRACASKGPSVVASPLLNLLVL